MDRPAAIGRAQDELVKLERRIAAGLDGLHFRDLRGTTCTLLADHGGTHSEIAAMLGWIVKTVNEMLDRHQAMTAVQSDSADAKLEARRK